MHFKHIRTIIPSKLGFEIGYRTPGLYSVTGLDKILMPDPQFKNDSREPVRGACHVISLNPENPRHINRFDMLGCQGEFDAFFVHWQNIHYVCSGEGYIYDFRGNPLGSFKGFTDLGTNYHIRHATIIGDRMVADAYSDNSHALNFVAGTFYPGVGRLAHRNPSPFDMEIDLTAALQGQYIPGRNDYVYAMAKVGDSAAVLLTDRGQTSPFGGAVAIMSVRGELERLFRVPENIHSMTSDNNLLYLAEPNAVHVYDSASGQEVGTIEKEGLLAHYAVAQGDSVVVISGPHVPREMKFNIFSKS